MDANGGLCSRIEPHQITDSWGANDTGLLIKQHHALKTNYRHADVEQPNMQMYSICIVSIALHDRASQHHMPLYLYIYIINNHTASHRQSYAIVMLLHFPVIRYSLYIATATFHCAHGSIRSFKHVMIYRMPCNHNTPAGWQRSASINPVDP